METPREHFWRHALTVFVACVFLYFAGFWGAQQWRAHRGPWVVTFGVATNGTPVVAVAQPWLGIRDVRFTFPGTNAPGVTTNVTVRFDDPAHAGAVPFGKVEFLDTTYLPGTVTLVVFGHEIEFLPRTLTVDKREEPWRAGARFDLPAR